MNSPGPEQSVPPPGRYPPQRGFAWTNSVFVALLVRVIFGLEVRMNHGEAPLRPSFPREWAGKEIELSLPNYPWPEGVIIREIAA